MSPSPRSMYSDEFNSTFNSTQESTEVFEGEDKGRLIDLAGIMKRSRSSSSQSDASESSTDSIVRLGYSKFDIRSYFIKYLYFSYLCNSGFI